MQSNFWLWQKSLSSVAFDNQMFENCKRNSKVVTFTKKEKGKKLIELQPRGKTIGGMHWIIILELLLCFLLKNQLSFFIY